MDTEVKPARKGWLQILRRAAEPPFFLYVFALMLHNPLLQQYVYSRISEDYGYPYQFSGDSSSCKDGGQNKTLKLLQQKVQAKAAHFQIGLSLFNTIPSVFVCLFLGTWSDNVGRKPIIALGILGGFMESVFVMLTMYMKLPLYVIYIGCFFNGLGGYFTGLQLAVLAYIADITEKEKRALRLGLMEAVIFFGAMLSNFSSGHLINAYGFKRPYIIVAVCLVSAFLYTLFILPESLQSPCRKADVTFRAVLRYPSRVWWVLSKPRIEKWKILFMMPAALLITLMSLGVHQVITLYVLNAPFCWPSIQVGYFSGTRLLLLGLGAAVGLKLLSKCLPEYGIAIIGLFSFAAFYSLLAVAKEKSTLYIACFAGAFSATCGPIYRGILSKAVDSDEQGSLFSAVSSLETLSVFAGALLFNAFYPFANARGTPGLTFLLNVALLIIPLTLNIVYFVRIRKENRKCAEDLRDVLGNSDDDTASMPASVQTGYGAADQTPYIS